jgi:hypothetical protein
LNHRIQVATGHVFGLNLRTRAIAHLAHCDEKTKFREHDSVGKREGMAEI